MLFNILTNVAEVMVEVATTLFSGNNEIVIPWEKIKCIGDEIILVEI